MFHINFYGIDILYTGDHNIRPDVVIRGADKVPRNIDILISESTDALIENPKEDEPLNAMK